MCSMVFMPNLGITAEGLPLISPRYLYVCRGSTLKWFGGKNKSDRSGSDSKISVGNVGSPLWNCNLCWLSLDTEVRQLVSLGPVGARYMSPRYRRSDRVRGAWPPGTGKSVGCGSLGPDPGAYLLGEYWFYEPRGGESDRAWVSWSGSQGRHNRWVSGS